MDDIPARCMFRIKKIIKNKSKKSLWNAEKLAWVIFQLGACLKLPLVETYTWDLFAKTQNAHHNVLLCFSAVKRHCTDWYEI